VSCDERVTKTLSPVGEGGERSEPGEGFVFVLFTPHLVLASLRAARTSLFHKRHRDFWSERP
jgi:hypothetical protein